MRKLGDADTGGTAVLLTCTPLRRQYAHTRMVLLHELTHNKHGDHDEQCEYARPYRLTSFEV